MHPVRAGIVNSPELYPCSSYRFRAFGEKSSVLDLDPWYNSSSSDIEGRQLSYRRFFQNSIPHPAYQLIREMTNKDGIAGRSSFKEQIQKIVGREIIFRSPGRPKRQEK
jgi:putative transposase